MFCKHKKICYNGFMYRKDRMQNRNIYTTLGESSPYKQAGFAFTATPFVSFFVSFLFVLTLGFLGVGESFSQTDIHRKHDRYDDKESCKNSENS